MPYPTEHACRLKSPDQFDRFSRSNCAQKYDGKCIDVIWGIKGEKVEAQALRYPKEVWTADAAHNHCDSRGGSFEPASGEGKTMTLRHRAYSVLNVKSVDDELRTIEGIASTPATDRMDDKVSPEGIEFDLPLPFLYQHNAKQPIGLVTWAKSSAEGLAVRVKIAAAGTAQFIDEAWALIKSGLVRGLSIGFRSLEESWDKQRGGFNFLRTELLEISAVTIPANAEASITTIKSADADMRAAFGHGRNDPVRLDATKTTPGVSGIQQQENEMKTLQEQISSWEAKRQANVARKEAIMAKAAEEGRTLDAAESEEYDGLESEVADVDKHLVRLRAHEKQAVAAAIPITEKSAQNPEQASKLRGGVVTAFGPDLPKGTAFTRYSIALMRARGNLPQAAQIARSWKDSTPQVEAVLKAAVDAGTTTDTEWASKLADYVWMASEFIEYLRPQTIIGKIPGLRRVPFNIKMPLQDAGSSVNWVGEGAAKPVSKLSFDTTTLRFAKAAGIVVMTDELVRFSNPSAEALVRTDLAAAIRQFLDEQFIDPTVTAVANVSPASIANGAGNAAASGTTADDFRQDFKAALQVIIAANIDPTGLVIVMQPTLAVSLSLMRNALGQKEFPDINASGGRLEGYEVVTSNSVPSGDVVFVKPSEILLADDGGITLDASREASIVMDDGVSPAVTTMVSLWQNNMVALRAERIINWARRRTAAVYYITAANYGATSP